MYTRSPVPFDRQRQNGRREPSYRRMSGLPPNYGGTMLRAMEPDREEPTPRFDDLPKVSDLSVPPTAEKAQETSADATTPNATPPAHPVGLFSLFDSRRFPFGHGIGYEELLLLGLIFFLAKECDGEGDLKETLLLLGLLLLGG